MKSKSESIKFLTVKILLIFSLIIGVFAPILSTTTGALNTQEPKILGHNLILSDKIGVNFHMALPENISESDYMEFSMPNKKQPLKVSVSEATLSGGNYVFTCPMVAKEMTDLITATMYVNGTPYKSGTMSVVKYADKILKDTSGKYNQQTKNIVTSMLNYGAAAQTYFGYNSGVLANNGINRTVFSSNTSFDAHCKIVSGKASSIKYFGSTLVLESEMAVRHYFVLDYANDIQNFDFEIIKIGEEKRNIKCEPVMKSKGNYYVELDRISPTRLKEDYVLKVTNLQDKSYMTITYSPYTYAKNMVNSANKNFCNLLVSMADYCEDALIYEKSKSNADIKWAESVNVDGKMDEIYKDSLTLSTCDNFDLSKTGDAKLWFANSNKGLYVYAEIKNEKIENEDAIYVYVDFVNDHEISGLNGDNYLNQNRDTDPVSNANAWDSNRIGWIGSKANGESTIYQGFWKSGNTDARSKATTTDIKDANGNVIGYTAEMFFEFPTAKYLNYSVGIGVELYDGAKIKHDTYFGAEYSKHYEYLLSYDLAVDNNAKINGIYDIAQDNTKPVIDAFKDSVYDDALCIETYVPKADENNPEGKFKAWFVSDNFGLYVYTQVADTTYSAYDYIQFYFDFVNDHETSGLSGNDYLYQNQDKVPTCDVGQDPGGNWVGDTNKIGYVQIWRDGTFQYWHGFYDYGQRVKSGTSSFKKDENGYVAEFFVPFPEDMNNKVIGIGIGTSNDKNNDQISDESRFDCEYNIGSSYWSDYTRLFDYVLQDKYYLMNLNSENDDLKIDGIGITEFKIVYRNKNNTEEKRAAEKLQKFINDNYGINIEIATDSSIGTGAEIIIGDSSHVTKLMKSKINRIPDYRVGASNSAIISGEGYVWICAENNYTIVDAIDRFTEDIKPDNKGKKDISYANIENTVKVNTTISDEIFKLMSYNVRNDGRTDQGNLPGSTTRVDDVITNIKSYMPDVIGMQEANGHWKDIFDKEGFSGNYNYIGEPREQNPDKDAEYTLVLYNKNKFNLIDSGTKWLSETPDVPSSLPHPTNPNYWDIYNRTMTYLILERKSDGTKFMTVNCHLSWDAEGYKFCLEQTKIMLDLTNQILARVGDMPVYFTGDFNTSPETDGYNKMIESDYVDARYNAEITTENYTHAENGAYHTFDYFFTSHGDFSIKKFEVDHGKVGSDHFPVYVEAYIYNRK